MAAMTSKFYYVCVIQYYSDQWIAGSIPAMVRHVFQLAWCGDKVKVRPNIISPECITSKDKIKNIKYRCNEQECKAKKKHLRAP